MKKLLANLIWLAVVAALVGSIHLQSAGLASVAGVALWLTMLAGVFCAVVVILASYLAEEGEDPEKRTRAGGAIRSIVENMKRSKLGRVFSWVKLVALVVAAAYAGLAFTAFCYVVVTGLLAFALYVARSTVKKLDAAEAAAPASA